MMIKRQFLTYAILLTINLPITSQGLPDFLFEERYWSDTTSTPAFANIQGNAIGMLTNAVGGVNPIGSSDYYRSLLTGPSNPIIYFEIDRVNKIDIPVVLYSSSWQGITVPNSETKMYPVKGFNNTTYPNKMAVNTDPLSWPEDGWPDKPNWNDDGSTDWNSFLGRGNTEIASETYAWMDDHKATYINEEFGYLPIEGKDRLGAGLAIKFRSIQFKENELNHVTYLIYELVNVSDHDFKNVQFGFYWTTLSGGYGDSSDDLSFVDQGKSLVASRDFDNSGNTGGDVPITAFKVIETALVPYKDGIDNNNNSQTKDENQKFDADDFQPRILSANDPIVSIDKRGNRSISYLKQDEPLTVISQNIEYNVNVGDTLKERMWEDLVLKDGIDSDLDGIIDEDKHLHHEIFVIQDGEHYTDFLSKEDTFISHVNYVDFAIATQNTTPTKEDSVTFGLLNEEIDEKGEQFGLTSYKHETPPGAMMPSSVDEVKKYTYPGKFDFMSMSDQYNAGGVDGDILFSPGQFELKSKHSQRIVLAFISTYGDWDDLFSIQSYAQNYYEQILSIEGENPLPILANYELPNKVELNQNYPNPFNPSTQIEFALPQNSDVNLEIFNIMGQRVATLVNKPMSAGQHRVSFDATSLSSGIYFYRLTVGSVQITKQMTLIK